MNDLWVGVYGLGVSIIGAVESDWLVAGAGVGLLLLAAVRLLTDHRLVEQAAQSQRDTIASLQQRVRDLEDELRRRTYPYRFEEGES